MNDTKVRDIDALSGLINLTTLELRGIEIKNLSALSRLFAVKRINLQDSKTASIPQSLLDLNLDFITKRKEFFLLGLNDLDKKCIVRYEIATKMVKRLLEICDYAKLNIAELPYDIRKRNKVVHGCRDLLYKCVPSAEYSAFTATALQTDSNYIELKKILIDTGQWNEELEALDKESKQCVYRITPKMESFHII